MLRRILISFAAVLCLCSCTGHGKLIPPEKMSDIYAQMYVSDQWLLKNTRIRASLDTSLFYDRVLADMGYDFEDYDYSVRKYLEKPEKLKKIFERTQEKLSVRRKELTAMKEIEEKNKQFFLQFKGQYTSQDFWPRKYNSSNYSLYVERENSVRTDFKQKAGDLVGFEPAADRR